MSSSIELINPKAESIRRAAALQVTILLTFHLRFSLPLLYIEPGQHQWSNGSRERRQGQSWYDALFFLSCT